MQSYRHIQIRRIIEDLDQPPIAPADYSPWILAPRHLQFVKDNRLDDEVILYASGPFTFIHAVVTKETDLDNIDHDDLLDWDTSPYTSRASYVHQGDTDDVWIEYHESRPKPTTIPNRQNLIFARAIDRDDTRDSLYYEVLQEFAHVAGIHWRPEQRAYCRLDHSGNIEPVVSITQRDDSSPVALVTCKRKPLEQYLAASGNVLVQFFEFMMANHDEFNGWYDCTPQQTVESDEFLYTQLIIPRKHAWTRGVQIDHPTTPKPELLRSIIDSWSMPEIQQYVQFKAIDHRHGQVKLISTDPAHTTNYFEAHLNSLPYEVSPAFFDAEVLSKYKADRDKYTVDERNRTIYCRGSWSLNRYDINEAGQVHAYICYLQQLPETEQLHWRQFNQEPQGSISTRAFEQDIKGEWSSHQTPLDSILEIADKWSQANHHWWDLTDKSLLSKVTTPVAESRDEWGRSFLDLATLINQNFNTKAIAKLLTDNGIDYAKGEGSLTLIERLISSQRPSNEPIRLNGLKEAQQIRSKVTAHGGGRQANNIAQRALLDHGTYKAHFEHVCDQIAVELQQIEDAFSAS